MVTSLKIQAWDPSFPGWSTAFWTKFNKFKKNFNINYVNSYAHQENNFIKHFSWNSCNKIRKRWASLSSGTWSHLLIFVYSWAGNYADGNFHDSPFLLIKLRLLWCLFQNINDKYKTLAIACFITRGMRMWLFLLKRERFGNSLIILYLHRYFFNYLCARTRLFISKFLIILMLKKRDTLKLSYIFTTPTIWRTTRLASKSWL